MTDLMAQWPSPEEYVAEQARNAGQEAADEHADDEWFAAALDILHRIAEHQFEITSDDVWAELAKLEAVTHEPRAIANVFKRAKAEGWIRSTDRMVPGTRPSRHAARVALWLSELVTQ